MFYLVFLILLSGCKSLELDSLVHPHVTNHIHVSLADEIKKAVREEKVKEDKRLKSLHQIEEETMAKEHLSLEEAVKKIHASAEKKSYENFLKLEQRLLGIIALMERQNKEPQD